MLKTLLAAAMIAGGAVAVPAAAAPLAPTVDGAAIDDLLLDGASFGDADAGIVPIHYRGRRHYHGRRHYRPRSGVSVQLNFGTVPRYRYRDPYYRHAPRYRRAAPIYRSYGSRHHSWCANRYRSYRVADGTFQPYHGSRRRCNSPYDGI